MERRLAAVLVADMVGFSRLMENNESDIINRQKNQGNYCRKFKKF